MHNWLVLGRLFLHLGPARVGVLLTPGPFSLGIESALQCQTIQRTMVIRQIENAIARLEVEICSVQLGAMRQRLGEGALYDLHIDYSALEVVGTGILSVERPCKLSGQQHTRRDTPQQ